MTSSITVIGLPMPPKATGAVLAKRQTAAALSGWKPSAISITAQTATGAPPPASASSSAPNANAITTACTRWSSLMVLNERRMTSKWPDSTVSL